MSSSVTPPPDGLHRALRDAQRRRMHRAGLSSSVTALGCALLLALGSGAGNDLLSQDPAPSFGDTDALLLTPSPHGSAPADGPVPTTQDGVRAAPRAPAAAVEAGPPADRGGASPASPQPAAPPAAQRSAPMRSEGPAFIVSPRSTCSVERALCSGVDVTPDGEAFVVRALLCSHGPSPVVLRFPSGSEVDLLVGPPGAPLWRWSDGQAPDPTPHEIRLEQGQCWEWTTTYDGRDAAGTPLPEGSHRMTAEFQAEDLAGAASATTDFRARG